MRRFHLIELHEQSWYPAAWRELFQLLLGRAGILLGVFDGAVPLLARLFERLRPANALDLCSGSGELAVDLWRRAVASCDPPLSTKLLLSDLHPHRALYRDLRRRHPAAVDFEAAPLDARNVPTRLTQGDTPRLWMMLESLHHFPPAEATRLLDQAAARADGVVILESTERTLRRLVQVALTVPFMAAFFAVFRLPFAWRHLLWGLLIPVLPLTALVDSVVSNLRSYTPAELEAMTRQAGRGAFHWQVGTVEIPKSGGLQATYVLGWRRRSLE